MYSIHQKLPKDQKEENSTFLNIFTTATFHLTNSPQKISLLFIHPAGCAADFVGRKLFCIRWLLPPPHHCNSSSSEDPTSTFHPELNPVKKILYRKFIFHPELNTGKTSLYETLFSPRVEPCERKKRNFLITPSLIHLLISL